jgi:hypothetical protein
VIVTKQEEQERKEKQNDPMTMFMYGLRAPETKRQYPRRLKVFLDFLKHGDNLEQQS